jgi:acetylornithine deacetylase/succinyl-diaminopimelate desuccinylase-like protein
MDTAALAALVVGLLDDAYLSDVLVRLLRTPTDVATGATAGEPGDLRLARYVRNVVQPELERLKLGPVTVDSSNALLCRIGPVVDSPSLLLIGYAAASHADRMAAPYSGDLTSVAGDGVDELYAFGQGAAEHKGALAAALAALRLVAASGVRLRGRLVFAVNPEAAGGAAGARRLVERHAVRADQALLLVGTGNQIVLDHPGRLAVEITIRGRAAHSSRPDLALSAVDGAARALARLGAWGGAGAPRAPGATQATIARLVCTPLAPETVPDTAQLTLDWRLRPGDDPAGAVAAVRAALGDLAPYGVEVAAGAYRPAGAVAADLPLVLTLEEAAATLHGAPLETTSGPTALDAGYLGSAGIPSVACGPGRLSLGSDLVGDESVALSETWAAARLYAYAILALLAE